MKNILMTGGFGFIGFNALIDWKKSHPDLNLVNVDSETYAAQYLLPEKKKILKSLNIPSYKADIRDISQVDQIVDSNHIDTIINFAAESHVDNSIHDPTIFFETNIMGVANLLEISRKRNLRFHQVSTDEVIGAISPESNQDCTENAPFNPTSPYASSKASAELIANSYFKTFKTRITISRCTNNIGEWQNPEKLVPKTISNAINNIQIPVYGNGNQRRFWIDVKSHNDAIMKILESGTIGDTYNISPRKENLIENIDLVNQILEILKKPQSLISYVTDRPAHDICYYLDGKKMEKELEWKDNGNFRETLERTIDWVKKYDIM